jgi:hypothetical protein
MSPDKLDATLHEFGVQLAGLTGVVTTQLHNLTALVEKHEHALFSIEPPGLDKRTDRLEQESRRRGWGLRTALVAGLGALGTAAANYYQAWHN